MGGGSSEPPQTPLPMGLLVFTLPCKFENLVVTELSMISIKQGVRGY